MGQVQEAGSPEAEVAGRASGFEGFFRAEHVRLLRALYVVTGNEGEAEELMQEAFLRVWERWDRVQVMGDPVGYLYRIAMNAWRSRGRRLARAAKRAIGGVGTPPDQFAEVDERDAVMRALAHLTPRQRAALVLTEMVGYSSEEAGPMLGVKAVTVRVLASQGRDALRKTMGATDG